MKKIALFLVSMVLFNNVSLAFVTRRIDVTLEKIIPFSFSSEIENLEDDLSIRGFKNVKIKEVYVDNGEAKAEVDGNYIEMEFKGGKWNDSYKVINKLDTITLEDVIADNETEKTILIIPDKEVKSIQSVSGDFEEARINSDGNIEIIIKKSAEGVMSYDEDFLVKSQFTININEENLEREIEEKVTLPHNVQGEIIAKSGDTSSVKDIYVNGNEVTVKFNDGIPVPKETFVKSGYTYVWVDRNSEGLFNPYNPNSIYSTDKNKISGLGEYIGENEFKGIGITVGDDKWTDYCGIEKDGVRYIYTFDKTRGVPKEFIGDLVEKESITFSEQNFNSEEHTVYFSDAGVSYIPEGKLYSAGVLVKGAEDWGEVAPNRDWESKETFFNSITGKYETYVKHFKFFYGPREKKTFGGYYTYPYSCIFEYQHYKPITCYSGEVAYVYESSEKIRGYSYNGWVKIEYEEEREVTDYPPTPPFNVKYNSFTGEITWEKGNDDYTPAENLIYEIEGFDGNWNFVKKSIFKELKAEYKVDYDEPDVRVRAIDETGQASEWAYASNSEIELTGELNPYIVKPGDTVGIFANTKSMEKIKSVVAKNDEINMCVELQRLSETTPSFFEFSYDIETDFLEDADEYLAVTNKMVASGNKEEFHSFKHSNEKKFDDGGIKFSIEKNITLDKKGSIIFSNLNYNNVPLDPFLCNSNYWFLRWSNTVYIKNTLTGSEEIFFCLESEPDEEYINYQYIIIPEYRIKVNKFKHDEKGNPIYEYIHVNKEDLIKPFSLTWNTDASGITKFNLFLGNDLIYTYDTDWEEINTNTNQIYYIRMFKQMRRVSRTSYGYIHPSKTTKANWNEIVFSLMKDRDLRDFPWLGYKVRLNEYVKQKYVDEYNSNPNVRNNYRLLIADENISKNAIMKYNDILKSTNISMTRYRETIFGDDAMEYTSVFEKADVKVPDDTLPGKYEIDLVATDVVGNIEELKLTLIIQADDEEKEDVDKGTVDKKEDVDKEIRVVDNFFGRFFYNDGKGYLEELKKTNTTTENGFICAGETLGFTLVTEGVDYIELDFLGDESIKTLDYLTKKFLIDIPLKNGKEVTDITYLYDDFPKKVYPQYVDNLETNIFKWFYVVPYGTNQSLESWNSLKNNTLENIDITKLFERIIEPYDLVIYLNGDREKAIHLRFDVFERWDTVLNRDVREYVVNSDTRWEMRIDK